MPLNFLGSSEHWAINFHEYSSVSFCQYSSCRTVFHQWMETSWFTVCKHMYLWLVYIILGFFPVFVFGSVYTTLVSFLLILTQTVIVDLESISGFPQQLNVFVDLSLHVPVFKVFLCKRRINSLSFPLLCMFMFRL